MKALFFKWTRDMLQAAGESAAVGFERAKGERVASELRQELVRLQSENNQLQQLVAQRDLQIRNLEELTIPRLERQIELVRAEAEYAVALHQRVLKRAEADIAISNMAIAEATTRADQSGKR